jgi:hypothetical protein
MHAARAATDDADEVAAAAAGAAPPRMHACSLKSMLATLCMLGTQPATAAALRMLRRPCYAARLRATLHGAVHLHDHAAFSRSLCCLSCCPVCATMCRTPLLPSNKWAVC